MEHLAEFLDVLEPPLQIAKPNKYKIITLDVPIGKFSSQSHHYRVAQKKRTPLA